MLAANVVFLDCFVGGSTTAELLPSLAARMTEQLLPTFGDEDVPMSSLTTSKIRIVAVLLGLSTWACGGTDSPDDGAGATSMSGGSAGG